MSLLFSLKFIDWYDWRQLRRQLLICENEPPSAGTKVLELLAVGLTLVLGLIEVGSAKNVYIPQKMIASIETIK